MINPLQVLQFFDHISGRVNQGCTKEQAFQGNYCGIDEIIAPGKLQHESLNPGAKIRSVMLMDKKKLIITTRDTRAMHGPIVQFKETSFNVL